MHRQGMVKLAVGAGRARHEERVDRKREEPAGDSKVVRSSTVHQDIQDEPFDDVGFDNVARGVLADTMRGAAARNQILSRLRSRAWRVVIWAPINAECQHLSSSTAPIKAAGKGRRGPRKGGQGPRADGRGPESGGHGPRAGGRGSGAAGSGPEVSIFRSLDGC